MFSAGAEKFIPDLEWCQKLEEVGWGRDTFFSWVTPWLTGGCKDPQLWCMGRQVNKCAHDKERFRFIAPAPTVGEMGEVLPEYLAMNEIEYIKFEKINGSYFVNYGDIFLVKDVNDKKEANARAKMIVWLVKNGHLKREVIGG